MMLRNTFKATMAKGENGVVLLKAKVFQTTKNKLIDALLKDEVEFQDEEEMEYVSIDLEKIPDENGVYECDIHYYFEQGKDQYGNLVANEDKHRFVVEQAKEIMAQELK